MTETEKKYLAPNRALAAQPRGPVRLRVVQTNDRESLIELAVDYERAELPDRRYYADYCDISKARAGYNLVFGRLSPGLSTLRTKVEIAFPEENLIGQLWRSSRDLHDSLRAEWSEKPLPTVHDIPDPNLVQGFRANNVFMAILSEEAVMDFYYISPPDIHFVRTGKRSEVYLEPIIRITMASALLYEFLEKCGVQLQTIPDIERKLARYKEITQ